MCYATASYATVYPVEDKSYADIQKKRLQGL